MINRVPAKVRVRALAIAATAIFFAPPLLASAPASAQTAAASMLTGIVTDASGKALGDARVVVTSSTLTQTVRSGGDGRFAIALRPDTYNVTVSANGFETTQQEGVTVLAGQATSVKFSLSNITLQTIGHVVVANRATSINRTPAATSDVTSQTFTDQGQNQVVNILDQIPGVEIQRDSSNAPGANTSISIRGAQPYESQILIDGHPVVSSANGAAGFNGTFINSLLLSDIEIDKGAGNLPNTIENAVGGTLNFKTPTISGGPTANFLAGYDSFDGSYFSIKASDTFGKLGVLVGIAENETPGYLAPQTIYGGQIYPRVHAGEAYDPHIGVVDFGYLATQDFGSRTQLGKISYNFSPQTSILLEQYSTQTNNDETGTNYQYVNGTIVPCIDTAPAGGLGDCTEAGGTNQNYTSTPNLNLIGKSVPINLYAPYPSTTEFDNEPIYSAEFRTVVGPGSLLARYYTGTIDRTITQTYNAVADIPCSSPACPTGNDLTTNPPTYGSYQGEPYVENTIDILHGADAQYSVPFGNNVVTLGFDRHVDAATFGEYDPTLGPPTFTQDLTIQSLAYSLRGTFALSPKLTLQSGNYLSSTTYVGSRFDPRLGLTYRVNPNAVVRASYASAYVAPYYGIINTQTQFAQGALTLPSLAFKPETSSGYDLGSDIKLSPDTLISTDLYLNNIFNRYASVTQQLTGTYNGQPYTSVTQEGNQANVREEGFEFQLLHAPRIGLGFHTAVDLLRDYAYNQDPNVAVDSIFSATPDNYVQLPQYPYSKIRNDLFYSFANGAQVRLSSTSYGANNALGQPGFTEFDGEARLLLQHALVLNIGCTNLFNHDDYQAGGIYDGGPTFAVLGGGNSYTSRFFVQPRTVYVQLQRSIGPSGTNNLPRASL